MAIIKTNLNSLQSHTHNQQTLATHSIPSFNLNSTDINLIMDENKMILTTVGGGGAHFSANSGSQLNVNASSFVCRQGQS